ncbi:MAG: hypothetical protein KC613_10000 [Myxococcales bacterium]|nr:hypothetical protein [Myxococcales bacterium]MCB9522609.1 hypothetical protein [Myxococcales bacterium]
MSRLHTLALACTVASGLSAATAHGQVRLLRTASTGTSTASTGTATTTAPALIALQPQQGARLHRTVFIDGHGAPNDTAQGVLALDPALLARHTGLDHGYVHLITELGAVTYNVPFDARPDAALPPAMARQGVRGDGQVPALQVPFALSSDAPVASLVAQLAVSATPVQDGASFKVALAKVPPSTFPVIALPEAIGGDGPTDLDYAGPGVDPMPPPPPTPGDFEQGGFQPEYIYSQPHLENVETAWNQCAPAGYANGLAYLEAAYHAWGIDFPQDHIPGVAFDGDETSLVSRVEWYMDRPQTDTCNGSGTMRCNTFGDSNPSSSMRGIFEYLAAFDQDQRVSLRHQGGSETYPCGLPEPLDRESHREGANVTFEWLCDRVQDGSAVVLTVGFYDWVGYGVGGDSEPWDRTGGHVVRVYGCGEVNGQRFLRTLDDGQQDRMEDTDADDVADLCVERGGLRTQHWWVPVPTAQGRLQLGGYDRQIDFAMAMTAEL